MKKLGKRGFTLIELLAVIVILGVLLAIAIPAVSKYISTSRKSTYVVNAQEYVDAVKNDTYIGGDIPFPVQQNTATVITFEKLRELLEKGGKKSPYNGTFEKEHSFVVIVNVDKPESPRYKYYIAAIDSKGYGIGSGNASAIVEYDSLKEENIIQLGSSTTSLPAKGGKITLVSDDSEYSFSNIEVTEVVTAKTAAAE